MMGGRTNEEMEWEEFVPLDWEPPLLAEGTLRGELHPGTLPLVEWDD